MSSIVVLTDRRQVPAGRDLEEVVMVAVEGGATYVVLREKDLPVSDRRALARSIVRALGPDVASERLLVASDVDLALEVGAAGVHLAASDAWPGERQLVVDDRRLLVGRSCHSEVELREAAHHSADYVTLSPVFPTSSKAGYGPVLGADELGRLCRSVPQVPVVALGGVGPGRVAPCLAAGAAGVAVMGEVMRAGDPRKAVASLRAEAARVAARE